MIPKSFELITTAYKEKREELQESKNIISGLQKQITGLQETISDLNNRIEQDALNKNQKVVAFSRIAKDAKIRYSDIEALGFSKVLSSKDFIKIDTIPVQQPSNGMSNWLIVSFLLKNAS